MHKITGTAKLPSIYNNIMGAASASRSPPCRQPSAAGRRLKRASHVQAREILVVLLADPLPARLDLRCILLGVADDALGYARSGAGRQIATRALLPYAVVLEISPSLEYIHTDIFRTTSAF